MSHTDNTLGHSPAVVTAVQTAPSGLQVVIVKDRRGHHEMLSNSVNRVAVALRKVGQRGVVRWRPVNGGYSLPFFTED